MICFNTISVKLSHCTHFTTKHIIYNIISIKKLRNAENCIVHLSCLCAFVTILHVRDSLVLCLCFWYSQYSTGLWHYVSDFVLNGMSAPPFLTAKGGSLPQHDLAVCTSSASCLGQKWLFLVPLPFFWLLTVACSQVHMLLFVRLLLLLRFSLVHHQHFKT